MHLAKKNIPLLLLRRLHSRVSERPHSVRLLAGLPPSSPSPYLIAVTFLPHPSLLRTGLRAADCSPSPTRGLSRAELRLLLALVRGGGKTLMDAGPGASALRRVAPRLLHPFPANYLSAFREEKSGERMPHSCRNFETNGPLI